ncbi:uncharacterized protein B0I36DRAFT_324335 [Microdochium trichocladiopsis]|uniref:Uncharacterized protein n=1 Tax=Microdochium trichocladiopsis TaxID=1682393 RepID=A0A9P8Y7D0_9PEZI|nr:uncharacterized protein B0I36DRAFT_324335 [Microdochium trichocladiopsis]KAH7031629.1 hypothetical protein B0I36DRAFT_324335 [Microdochium trichocladiopsis]
MDFGDLHDQAWECRDGADQAEAYYNQPLRAKNRELLDENLALKRLLRENGISWQNPSAKALRRRASTRLRSLGSSATPAPQRPLPHLPVEVHLKILYFALTSDHPIINPLCKSKPEHLTTQERTRPNQIAIHFLATCRAYHEEGARILWTNNHFLFTTPLAVKDFAEVPAQFRREIKDVTLRVVAKYYDDEDRTHRLPTTYHPDFKKPHKLRIHMRPKERTMARRGFRAYAWMQLIDFLEALLPPHQESPPTRRESKAVRRLSIDQLTPRARLFPNLERLRMDFVDFGEDILSFPPGQLHDLACHQLGRSLNELVLTGLPGDEPGFRVSTELAGLIKDEGLLIDHAPLMASQKQGIRHLPCDDDKCHYSSRVVRAMDSDHMRGHHHHDDHHHHHHDDDDTIDFPTAPPEMGEPPEHNAFSCRTIWKRRPVKLDDPTEREWELYDRISGLPWDDVEEEATMLDDIDSDGEGMECDNCGKTHPGAILPQDMMDLYDDM